MGWLVDGRDGKSGESLAEGRLKRQLSALTGVAPGTYDLGAMASPGRSAAAAAAAPHRHEYLMLSMLGREPAPKDGLHGADPAALVELCRAHRVAGIAHQGATRLRPRYDSALAGLRQAAHKTLVDNLVLLKALKETSAILRAEGIEFVLLKGASLLALLYPEIQLRPMTDIDFLIPKGAWPHLAAALRKKGFVTPSGKEEKFYWETWYHQLVRSPWSVSTNLEFHWNLESVERSRIDPEDLFRRAVVCELDGERYMRLGDDDLLIHLAVHLAHHYERPALIWVEDLRRLLRQGTFDWQRIERTARGWGVENCLAYSFGYVERAFPGTLPPPAQRFQFSPLRRYLLGRLSTDNPALPHAPVSGIKRHVVSMLLLDRWWDAARYIAAHAGMRAARLLGIGKRPPSG